MKSPRLGLGIVSIQRLMQSAASRGWDTDGRSLSTAVTVPLNPFDSIGTEEIAEAREKLPAKDGDTKKDRSAVQADRPIAKTLLVKNQDVEKTAVTDLAASPTEVPGCTTNESRPRSRRKKRHIWRRVKQMIIRRSITV